MLDNTDTGENAPSLDIALRDRVLERLGFSAPPAADLDGLQELFDAWCVSVPFDNVRKMTALQATDNRALPGGHADEFFESWLADGAGGTCWPINNALFELVRSLGFDACRIVAHMRDLGVVNHASMKVRLVDRTWVADFPLSHGVLLPLDQKVFIHTDPVFSVEMEAVGGGDVVVWADMPPNSAFLPCRLLAGEVTHDRFLANYELSRQRSPFNQRLYARRDRPEGPLVLVGNTRFSKTAAGLVSRDLSRQELLQALHDDIGLSDRLIDEWIRSGSLDASFEPPSGPRPPPVAGVPPSQRGRS